MLEFRFETFNTFNHAQFYPNGSVDGKHQRRDVWSCAESSATAHRTTGAQTDVLRVPTQNGTRSNLGGASRTHEETRT